MLHKLKIAGRIMFLSVLFLLIGLVQVNTVPGTAVTAYAAEADGWHGDADSGFYYTINGNRVTGMQKIAGSWYFFDPSGIRQSGAIMVNSKLYYFAPVSGRLTTGISGLRYADSAKTTLYYFNKKKDGSLAYSKWIKYKGKKYYAGLDGKLVFGTIQVKNKLYHIAGINVGRVKGYGKSPYDGEYYYAKSNGVLKTGLRKINGKLYYFDPKTGARTSGEVTVGKYTYYFSKSSGKAKTSGWVKTGGKYYYYNKKGHKVYGAVEYKGKTYWCDKNDNGARAVKKWINTGKNTYYFNKKGHISTGWFFVKGKRYYTDQYGRRGKTGWFTYAGRKYLLSKTSYAYTGFYRYGSKYYYFDDSKKAKSGGYYGAMATGWMTINSNRYYFYNDGHMAMGEWIYDESTSQLCYLSEKNGRVTERKYASSSGSYNIKVNRALNTITVYKGDVPVKAMLCSTARSGYTTPKGTFKTLDKLRWHTLVGPVYGQYCSHITSDILFHSVPYTTYGNIHTLEYWEYNKLGYAASMGCIRLCVRDAKWLYDNCPIGTTVVIYDDSSSAGPLGKPSTASIGIPTYKNYDPTDPNV